MLVFEPFLVGLAPFIILVALSKLAFIGFSFLNWAVQNCAELNTVLQVMPDKGRVDIYHCKGCKEQDNCHDV